MKNLKIQTFLLGAILCIRTLSIGQCSIEKFISDDNQPIVQAKAEQILMNVGDRENGYSALGYTIVFGRLYSLGTKLFWEIGVSIKNNERVIPRELEVYF